MATYLSLIRSTKMIAHSTLTIFPPPVIPYQVDIIPPEPQPFERASFLQVLLQEFCIIPFLFTVGFIVAGLTSVLILFVFKPDLPPPPTLEPTKEIVLCLSPYSCKVLFEDTLREIERELYLFRDEIVRVHALSCDECLLNCSKSNYNECNSVFPVSR
jgi:hypothetical protein